MKKLSLNQIKEIELNILSTVADFCEKNNLKYCLAYGTLIGAIRHKGFIPWDDDIDIWMPRDDYIKFIRDFKHPYYRVQAIENTRNWNILFAKVDDTRTIIDKEGYIHFGLFIDIFPIDGLSNDMKTAKNFYSQLLPSRTDYHTLFYFANKPLSFKSKFKHNLFTLYAKTLMRLGYISRQVDSLTRKMQVYNFYESKYCDIISGTLENYFESHLFVDIIEAPFEGKQFKIPSNYDLLLRAFYGDYMKLPPIEKRTQYHDFMAFEK